MIRMRFRHGDFLAAFIAFSALALVSCPLVSGKKLPKIQMLFLPGENILPNAPRLRHFIILKKGGDFRFQIFRVQFSSGMILIEFPPVIPPLVCVLNSGSSGPVNATSRSNSGSGPFRSEIIPGLNRVVSPGVVAFLPGVGRSGPSGPAERSEMTSPLK